MAVVAIPNTFTTATVIDAAQVNTNFSILYNEFNGNIDNANIKVGANIDAAKLLAASIVSGKLADNLIIESKLDYTSTKILRVGPNIGGTNGIRLAKGRKQAIFSASAGLNNQVVTFSSDADDGNPNFSAVPRVIGFIVEIGATSSVRVYATLENPTQTTFTFHLVANVVNSETVYLHWAVIGSI